MPRPSRFDGPEPICLYPDEKQLAGLIMGSKASMGWTGLAVVLERGGLPRIDLQFGGRYWPAVKAFLDRRNHVGEEFDALRFHKEREARHMIGPPRYDGPEPSCLYPSDKEIGRLLMGPTRGKSWPGLAKILERSGLPMIDPQFGGRYWPAVRGFLDRLHNVDRFDPQGPMAREMRSNGRRPDIIDPELMKLRPEKRFSRLIDQGMERRRKAAETRAQQALPPPVPDASDDPKPKK